MNATLNQVKVVPWTSSVRLRDPVWQSGVYTMAAAQAWGERHDHAIVYWSKRHGRVYAERAKK